MKKNDHPGVYIPPPLIYAASFFASILIQKILPIPRQAFHSTAARVTGWMFIGLALCILLPALWRFLKSKNTVVTIKPAHSLQTTGIYSITRNPMYTALLVLYFGIGCLAGNWWTFLISPLLVSIVQFYIIRKEEEYLHRRFGDSYELYKKQVRRWI